MLYGPATDIINKVISAENSYAPMTVLISLRYVTTLKYTLKKNMSKITRSEVIVPYIISTIQRI